MSSSSLRFFFSGGGGGGSKGEEEEPEDEVEADGYPNEFGEKLKGSISLGGGR